MKTTINLSLKTLQLLNHQARRLGMSRSLLIRNLLTRIEYLHRPTTWKNVCYQSSSDDEEWHTFHLELSDVEYEMLLDFRKFFKKSVSFLISQVIQKYCSPGSNEVLVGDNYRYTAYLVSMVELSNGTKTWNILWGVP